MEELFNILSSSARIDKSKRYTKKRSRDKSGNPSDQVAAGKDEADDDASSVDEGDNGAVAAAANIKSRDRTGKRDRSEEKLRQIHKEQIAAFRRSMSIKIANKHDPDISDPISSFHEIHAPSWWGDEDDSFRIIQRAIQANIEAGRWKEPTPIQMQAIPTLLQRRDFIGAAPTGSGKSGAFIIPALFLSSVDHDIFYSVGNENKKTKSKKKGKKRNHKASREGKIRCLFLAPSLELATQLHREVERLGMGKPGGLTSVLLSKSNASHVVSGTIGGKSGIDVLVSTPLRLVDSIEKGLRLDGIRLVILDEADRLLDAADGKTNPKKKDYEDGSEKMEQGKVSSNEDPGIQTSGSMQTRTFLAQMDIILSQVPAVATRALFSATVTQKVRSLSESILRNPVDVTIASSGVSGGANPNIDQELTFVGREEGKLLAIRQIVRRGQLRPPVIVFLQSQERAQALFEELLYDGIHVDVIHAGRSRSARESAVARFRNGDTWVLICTDLVARGVDFKAVNMVINYDLPESGITYIHRIGRTGRAGRSGKAITLFTEADFENLRAIANVMKQSGCKVEDWMLNLRKKKSVHIRRGRQTIDTTPVYDRAKKRKKQQMIQGSKRKKEAENEE